MGLFDAFRRRQPDADPLAGGAGGVQSAPHYAGPSDVTTYVLGYLKPGRQGAPS